MRRAGSALSSVLAVAVGLASTALAQLEPQPTAFDQEPPAASQPAQLTRAPELIKNVPAVFPLAAVAEGREGEVVMLLEIDGSGTVTHVAVTKSAGEDLDQAAQVAAQRFVFRPAEWNGVPGPIAIEYRQVFKLDTVVRQVPAASNPASEPASSQLAEDVDEATALINFEGLVREAGSKDPLEGVEVAVATAASVRTSVTDAAGRFSFRGIPPGPHRVSFNFNGYEPSSSTESFEVDKLVRMKVYLQRRVTNKFEIVVREKRPPTEVAKIALTREEVSTIPGTFGDPLRVIENLPGLARAPFIGGALIVRGANPADTGVYFDGVQIPILYHFGGLKSVVNPEFLDSIDFYPGGFGAKYGRATAGIVDVSSRELKMQNFHGVADINVIDSGFFFGGPITLSDKLPTVTVAAAARRSYIDALLPVVLDAVVPSGMSVIAAPVYWDYQLKAETVPWTGQTFSVFAFGSADDIRVLGNLGNNDVNLGLLQSFHRLDGRWQSRVSDQLSNTLQPFVGFDRTELKLSAGTINGGGAFDSYNWGLREALQWQPLDAARVTLGIDYLGNRSATDFSLPGGLRVVEVNGFPRIYERESNSSATQTVQTTTFDHDLGLYAEGVFDLLPCLRITPGMRLDLLHYAYSEQNKVAHDWGIYDGKPAHTIDLWNSDPRVAARLTVIKGSVLKTAVGVYRQPATSQQLNPDFGNMKLDQPRALQLIAGFEHSLLAQLTLDVQLYATRRDLLVESTAALVTHADGTQSALRYDNGGRGNTVGAEMLLRHEPFRYSLRPLGDWYRQTLPGLYFDWMSNVFTEVGVFGWVAYTLSRTEIDLDATRDWYSLAEYDQTHILTIVGQANLPFGVTLGARFRLVSGDPTTAPVGSIHDLDTNRYQGLQPAAYQSRLPAFHQLDVRIDRKWVFDNFSITPYLDLLNVYNQANAEGYFTDYRSTTQQPLNGLPILPNFGLKGDF